MKLFIVFVVSFALLLAGCSSETQDGETGTAGPTEANSGGAGNPKDIKAKLNVLNWGNPKEAEAYKKAIARFNEKYPNVEVANNLTPVASWSDYVDKWMTQVASGDSPDVINLAIEGTRLAVDKQLLMPLNEWIEGDAEVKELIGGVPAPVLSAFTVDDNTYLLPNGMQTMVMYYNTKIFEEKGIEPPKPDWTWEDFLAIAQKLTYGDGSDKVYGFGLQNGFFQLSPWWITNGTSPVTADFEGSNLSDPKFVETVQFITDLVREYKVSPDPLGLDVITQFGSGKLAMVGAGRWPLNGWRESGFTDFDVVPWPQKTASGTVFGTAGWGIGSATKNKELAWELIKELDSAATQQETMKIGQQIPVLESLAQQPSFLNTPPANIELLWSAAQSATPVAAPAFFRDMEQIVMRNIEKSLAGKSSPQEAMNQADKELKEAIQ
ncbi:ABC transporter substrate-binding protein [Paenibacillaceae bacterium WGS1546]|uniref:ABC transporter substrate-binding protein n=1 Tax=Cohnella sp. WGS1546 TaxID=3366810 RepID=UPI00372CF6CA